MVSCIIYRQSNWPVQVKWLTWDNESVAECEIKMGKYFSLWFLTGRLYCFPLQNTNAGLNLQSQTSIEIQKNLTKRGIGKIQTFYNGCLDSALGDYEEMHHTRWMYSCMSWQMLMLLRMCCYLSHSSKIQGGVSLYISARPIKVLFIL